MADSTGKIDVAFEKSSGKMFLAYQFTAGDDVTEQPTFGVQQTLGWKNMGPAPADGTKAADISEVSLRMVDASAITSKGGNYSFKYELDPDHVTDVVVKVWKAPPKSEDEPTVHQDEDQVALSTNHLNKQTVTVFRVVGGEALEIKEFQVSYRDQLGGLETVDAMDGPWASRSDKENPKAPKYDPKQEMTLSWTVSGAAFVDTVLQFELMKAQDVNDITRAGTDAAPASATWKYGKSSFFLHADLSIYDPATSKDKKRKPLQVKSIVIAPYFPDPVLTSFDITKGGTSINGATIGSGDGLQMQWTLTGSSKGTALIVVRESASGDGNSTNPSQVVDHITIKPHNDDTQTGSTPITIDDKFPVGSEWKYSAGLMGLQSAKRGTNPAPFEIDEEGSLVTRPPKVVLFNVNASKQAHPDTGNLDLQMCYPSGDLLLNVDYQVAATVNGSKVSFTGNTGNDGRVVVNLPAGASGASVTFTMGGQAVWTVPLQLS